MDGIEIVQAPCRSYAGFGGFCPPRAAAHVDIVFAEPLTSVAARIADAGHRIRSGRGAFAISVSPIAIVVNCGAEGRPEFLGELARAEYMGPIKSTVSPP